MFLLWGQSAQVAINAAKAGDLSIVANTESIILCGIKGRAVNFVNHASQSKNVGNVVLIQARRATAWHIGLDIKCSDASNSLHANLLLDRASVFEKA